VNNTLSKEQLIGAIICFACVIIALFYVATLFYPHWLEILGIQTTPANVQFWIIAVPVLAAFIAIMGIGAWIGWTMATTPPPKPIEDVTSEIEKETEKLEEKQPPPS
jgi:predicted DNA-binding transcriptional regulator